MTKPICMLNSSYDMLDEILEIGEKKAIDFDYSSMNKKVKFLTKKFVAHVKKTEFLMKNHMSQHFAQHGSPHSKDNKKSYVRCHH